MAPKSHHTKANQVYANSVPGGYNQDLTIDEISTALPPHLKSFATQELTDKVNQMVGDPDIAEQIRNNFVTYTKVLTEGRFKMEDYLNAIAYVSYKLMGHSNQDAYALTFPKRQTALVARGATQKDISAYVSIYSRGKLVNMIMEQTLVPSWILNQHMYQDALNKQAYLMAHANSEKVQTEAANSLLTHLKRPETKQVELNIGMQDTDGMSELKDMLSSLAETQRDLIGKGVKTQRVAHQGFGKAIDITPIEAEEVKK